jgi:hypothetical protein
VTKHLLVIGAQRCGTTYLHHLLEDHPQIAMARPTRPEPKFFLHPEQVAHGYEWYRQTYFGHAGDAVLLGEKSTSYLEYDVAADRAADLLGDPQVLVMLRDPVARAVSNWRFSSSHGLEERPLADALGGNLLRSRSWDPERTSVSPFAYLERGRYIDYLEPWWARFPDSLHVVLLPELVAGPAAARALFEEIGVAPAHEPPPLDTPVNSTGGTAPEQPSDQLDDVRGYFADSDARLAARLGRALPWRTSEGTRPASA